MLGKLPYFSALLLIVVAGITMSADNLGGDIVEVETRKIAPSGDPLRSPSSRPLESKGRGATNRSPRVLFITKKGCTRCEEELNRLRKPGGDFETMKLLGWKIGEDSSNHIQIVDRDEIPELVELLKVREYPTVACIVDGEIVRSFKEGCTTPLDSWTFGWLLKGQSERPQPAISEAARVETTGNYRLRGNHWSLDGNPNPTKQDVLNHLRGPNHAQVSAPYGAIDNWSLEELRSLHDDLHERYGPFAAESGPYQAPAANRSLDSFGGGRKVMGK